MAHLQMNCEAKKQKWYYDQAMSTMQLVLGDVVLMKNDAYQGKRKVKDQWSETEYVVVHQVTDGVPAYEVKDEAGNVKTVPCNQLFLVTTPMEAIIPLGAGASILEENVARSTLVECTSFKVESVSPEGSMEGADTLSPASRVPLAWVGGVLWPLPSVAPRPTMWRGLGAGARAMRKSTRPAGGTSKPCSHIPNTRCKGGGGATAVMGTFFLGPYRGGTTTPLMMIPSGNPREVLDLPVCPYDTSPRAPE